MAAYSFPATAAPSVPIADSDLLFPVRRIYCVGRNYAAHRREMGGDDRDPPFFFAKPADAVVPPGGPVPYPSATGDFQHEVELVAALGDGGVDIDVAAAAAMVFGYAVGVDLTRRDLQGLAKAKGQPWECGKGFDHSAPIGVIRPWRGPPPQGRIRLSVNGVGRQDAVIADMTWSVAEVIAEASKYWRLAPGDLIFTGTPEGVGPLIKGDVVEAEVEAVGALSFRVT